MKQIVVASLFGLVLAGAALGQSPVGEWLVQDGTARIRVVACGNALWGVISWTKGPAGTDQNNPDPAKRRRSIMGLPILLNMKPARGRWDGEVYNAENGQVYTSHISLASADVLKIEGCVLGGLICGGENWMRVQPESSQPSDQKVCSDVAK